MEGYAGQQVVGIDLHRRRSVIVRMDDQGHGLETIRISNDVDRLTEVMSRAGVQPEVVLEATYGWYWAADALAAMGAQVHLAHPLGVKAFSYRRVKNDVRDATDLADLLRMGRLPEAWIAPPPRRELRELVRHRAKLVALRSGCKCDEGTALLERLCPGRLIASVDRRVGRGRSICSIGWCAAGWSRTVATPRCSASPGSAPCWGPCSWRRSATCAGSQGRPLTCWAGLTPKHHESDTHVHRGRITKQGSRLVRWAAIESVQVLGPSTGAGRVKHRVADRRGRNIGKTAAARQQLEYVYYALRDGHVRALHQRPRAAA